MTTKRAGALLPYIRGWATRCGACEASDQELLERFIHSREQAAFATLVARHGPRVLGACRRVLRDEHAAEDAFQNVFLLLARKAGAIRERTLLAGWLYGVACRIAAHARTAAARRRGRETLVQAGRPPDDPPVEAAARELSAVLDEEVGRLPERYRSPIILCHVEGLARGEAARRLSCSPRTLQRRLERGGAVLRARLARRGVAHSAALIAPALWVRTVEAAVPSRLASAAVQAVVASGASTAALAGLAGVTTGRAVGAFLLARIKIALGLAAVLCLVGVGVGIACHGAVKEAPATAPAAGANREAAAPDPPAEPRKGDVAVPIDPKILAELAKQLRSQKFDERSAALAALEKLVPPGGAGDMDFQPVIEPLFEQCGWGGEAEKDARRAEELIARIGGQAAPFLRRRLESAEPRERRVAARLVARVEPPGPVLTELLRPLLADGDWEVRRWAIEGLGAQGPAAKSAISDLEKEGADPTRVNRVSACVALIHIAGPSEQRVGALADLLRLKKEPDDEAAVFAAMELARLGREAHPAAPQLLAALKLPGVRYAAAEALGPVGADPDVAVPVLIALLKNEEDDGGRLAVARALGNFGPAAASALPALRETLRSVGGGGWPAAEAIGKIGGPDAVPALVEALQSKDDQVRLTAIQGLGNLGGAAAPAVEALKKVRKDDPHPWNRKAAAALEKIAGPPNPRE